MTSEYTFIAPERQNELTRRIQQRLAAASKGANPNIAGETSSIRPILLDLESLTHVTQ